MITATQAKELVRDRKEILETPSNEIEEIIFDHINRGWLAANLADYPRLILEKPKLQGLGYLIDNSNMVYWMY